MTSSREFDILIIGMGPSGIAAACAAAESNQRVGVVDDNAREGGQIWRGEAMKPTSRQAADWMRRFRAAKVEILSETRVAEAPSAGLLYAESAGGSLELRYGKLILATGARERFLPFPGWTLPNVMGAGGLQALVKGGAPIRGKRVIVAGSGPLLLAVAAYLVKHGAEVPLIAEQADWPSVAGFSLRIAAEPSKALQGLALKWALRGVSYRTGCWPLEARGPDRLAEVALKRGGRAWTERCDYLACGFGLVPNLELPLLLGCAIRDGAVAVDSSQQTSLAGVYSAGEPNGIGGVDLALIEGEIAGYSAAGLRDRAASKQSARAGNLWLRAALERAFALRPELRDIATPGTIVCRCEDVTLERMRAFPSWRPAKLQTRCGMGPCQGRVCGPAAEFLLGWKHDTVRPPIFPVKVEHLAR